ncbi:MAG TPA: histidine kinase [Solirubrobacteraceae bacterium]
MPPRLARRAIDVAVVAMAILALVESVADPRLTPRAVTVPAALLFTLPLLARERYPFAAPVVVFATLAAEALLPGALVSGTESNVFPLILAFAVAGVHPDERRALAAGAVGYAAIGLIVLLDTTGPGDVVRIFVLCAAAWVIGRVIGDRNRRAAESESRAARLERDHETAVLAERARIAGELHDVLAHSVSVMTVQAGAARMLLDEDPERARAPLTAVEETGRQALGEMRRLLGILRGTDDEGTLAPQPGIGQLDALIGQVQAAGLTVDLSAAGEPRELPPGVDLTAYRLVQEALTNVLKHAGAARAHVSVRFEPDRLELEVVNTGHVVPGAGANGSGSGGHGLIGMRQRVALYGGELEAGPRPQGGYAVRARLPTGAEAPR